MQEVCIVVPCYNEVRRLHGPVFIAFLDAHPTFDLAFVDDGSVDGTREVLERLHESRPGRIFVHALTANAGKAAAVRSGVQHVVQLRRWSFVGYWDADLSTPLGEVDRLVTVLQEDSTRALVMGSRVKRLGANIERRISRDVIGRIFAACASGVLGVSLHDSQCGAKVFRADMASVLFDDPFLTNWLFDLEILMRLRNHAGPHGLAAVEVPLDRWKEVAGSKLGIRDMLYVPFELLAIWRRYHLSAR